MPARKIDKLKLIQEQRKIFIEDIKFKDNVSHADACKVVACRPAQHLLEAYQNEGVIDRLGVDKDEVRRILIDLEKRAYKNNVVAIPSSMVIAALYLASDLDPTKLSTILFKNDNQTEKNSVSHNSNAIYNTQYEIGNDLRRSLALLFPKEYQKKRAESVHGVYTREIREKYQQINNIKGVRANDELTRYMHAYPDLNLDQYTHFDESIPAPEICKRINCHYNHELLTILEKKGILDQLNADKEKTLGIMHDLEKRLYTRGKRANPVPLVTTSLYLATDNIIDKVSDTLRKDFYDLIEYKSHETDDLRLTHYILQVPRLADIDDLFDPVEIPVFKPQRGLKQFRILYQ